MTITRQDLTRELQKQRQNRINILAYDDEVLSAYCKEIHIKKLDIAIEQIKEDIRRLDGNHELRTMGRTPN